jgi:hypothetical protein
MRSTCDADPSLQQDRDRLDEEPRRPQNHLVVVIVEPSGQTFPRISKIFDDLRKAGLVISAAQQQTDRFDISNRLQNSASVLV